ncbi:peptidoglycan-binding domain-containing protein [Paraburkholderia youngii]|uniref:peptidoglycan-binding domain-containing protein n=2 Tax=Paraburkholderia TaxID=1822464 RepID=UPI003D21EEA3
MSSASSVKGKNGGAPDGEIPNSNLKNDVARCEMGISLAARTGLRIPEFMLRAVWPARAGLEAAKARPRAASAFYNAMTHTPYPNAKMADELGHRADVVSHAGLTGKPTSRCDIEALSVARQAENNFTRSATIEVSFYDATSRITHAVAPVVGATVGAHGATRTYAIAAAAVTLVVLSACASTPLGPTVQVMPGSAVPFRAFQQNQEECKQYAQSEVAGQAESANRAAVGSALLGVALGTALGAAAGDSQGAGVGAAVGGAAGTGAGATSSQIAQVSIQDQYNNAYMQCMYAKGNQIPGASAPQANAMPPAPLETSAMTVAQMQAKLNALGFPVGTPDGHMGSRTRRALKYFQKSVGLPQTGEPDSATVAALSQ